MLEDREKQLQKSHWRAIAEQLGLPTEPEEEGPIPESSTEYSSEPDEPEIVQTENVYPQNRQESPSSESWQAEVSQSTFERPRQELYPETSERENRPEPAPPQEEEEPEIIVTEGFIESEETEEEAEEPEAQPRRRRRRGRRGKRSPQKENSPMKSGEPSSQVLEETNEGEGSREGHDVEVSESETEESLVSKEGSTEEKPRRRRRSRSRRRDKKQKTKESVANLGDEMEETAQEDGPEAIIEEGPVEILDREEFSETEDREIVHKTSKSTRRRKEKDQETEEADYDIMDEESTDFSDWNVPSWQELIASLYRPER